MLRISMSQPTSIADTLADEFFTKKQSVILTSATLTVRMEHLII